MSNFSTTGTPSGTAMLHDGVLTVGNRFITRTWRVGEASLIATSCNDATREMEWVADGSDVPGFHHPTLMLPLEAPTDVQLATDDGGDGSLVATLTATRGGAGLTWRFRVWDDLPLIWQSVTVTGEADDTAWQRSEEPQLIDADGAHYRPTADRLDGFFLAEPQVNWTATATLGRSDWRDTLVERAVGVAFRKQTSRVAGNVLHVTRWDSGGGRASEGGASEGGAGLALLKLAPPLDEQLDNAAGCDFAVSGGHVAVCGSGLPVDGVHPTESYAWAVGVTDGSPSAGEALLRTLVRRLNPPRLPESGVVHANNWGGGGGVNTPTQAFLEKELPAAAKLGVSVYQIDAGWHVGDARALGVEKLEPRSTSGVHPDFWAVDPARFPDGPEPIRDLAASLGIEIGLWYCLDRADGYANWRQDLATMLGLHERFGCVHFKLDGLSLDSRAAERNLTALFAALDEQTAGRVVVSIDITGSQSRRLGLFHGLAHVRDHFVENRYTGSGTYWPHRALRNLWQLAHLVPTDRLEIEWLNTARHPERYSNHELAPAAFGTEYSLAVTLFALPLAWMHVQHLPPEDAKRCAKVLHAYRPHQHAILTGTVTPIGEEPSGASWTGFASRQERDHASSGGGYVVVYREVTERQHASFTVPGINVGQTVKLERIAGSGRQRRLTAAADGTVRFTLPRPRSYALYRWSAE